MKMNKRNRLLFFFRGPGNLMKGKTGLGIECFMTHDNADVLNVQLIRMHTEQLCVKF